MSTRGGGGGGGGGGGSGGGGNVHPKGESSTAVSGLGCSVGARWAVLSLTTIPSPCSKAILSAIIYLAS